MTVAQEVVRSNGTARALLRVSGIRQLVLVEVSNGLGRLRQQWQRALANRV